MPPRGQGLRYAGGFNSPPGDTRLRFPENTTFLFSSPLVERMRFVPEVPFVRVMLALAYEDASISIREGGTLAR